MTIAAISISNSVDEKIDRYQKVLWLKQQKNVRYAWRGELHLHHKWNPYPVADLMEKTPGICKVKNGSLDIPVKVCGNKPESIKDLKSTNVCILNNVDLAFLNDTCSYRKLFFGMNIWCINCYSSLRGSAFES
ncbi:hypothetical protein DMB44_01940 [Thermoplasma sp. Kam2015]|uniref:hypothetical protein n=1 Tax=Thermoplasma sp. Kam2015 TaxID=2094122 RepID=UPI000D825F3C|nr:hypothetical protein [Thermoplasma sp. Kam2015]PYB68670.1 hypothetical protein DMB44_01940 [Thermoplasma sp. Kam2015]